MSDEADQTARMVEEKRNAAEAIKVAEKLEAERTTEALTLLVDLAEQSRTDKGAPFEPGMLDALNILQVHAHADYQRHIGELKKAGIGPRDLKAALTRRKKLSATEDNINQNQDTERVGPYVVANGVINLEKQNHDGKYTVPLCNFDARIVGEVVHDDGAEQTTYFSIEGTLQCSKPLSKADVPADRFSSMNWVMDNWGTGPVIYAGHGARDHLRVAMQLLSGDVPRSTVFTHLGWRKIDDKWVYLHGGGAIGPNGPLTEVRVITSDSRLSLYSLPEPTTGDELKASIRASLSVLELGPHRITYPLISAVYRAPMGEVAALDLSIFIAGPTGTQKTEATAIAQAHCGAGFHGKSLPGNWATTANGLEKQAFLVKDAVFTVDDFAPTGTTSDVQRLHREADRLFRGQGNRAGRGRMRADGSMRPEYYPRGIVISSGEDIPRGQSLRARTIITELSPGDINLDKLTLAQSDASEGKFAAAMAGYIQWLAPRIDDLKAGAAVRLKGLRGKAREIQFSHDRTPDIVASLAMGFETFLQYARDAEAITEEESAAYKEQCWESLIEAAEAQVGYQADEDPASRFLTLLGSAVTSGQAHLADAGSGHYPDNPVSWGWQERTIGAGDYQRAEWQPNGPQVGWVKGGDLYLDPDAAFAAVQRIAVQQGSSLSITQSILWKRLAEKGVLASQDNRDDRIRNKIRKVISGHRHNVIHILADTLLPSTSGPIGPIGPQPSNSNGLGGDEVGYFSGTDEIAVHESGQESLENSKVWPLMRDGDQHSEEVM